MDNWSGFLLIFFFFFFFDSTTFLFWHSVWILAAPSCCYLAILMSLLVGEGNIILVQIPLVLVCLSAQHLVNNILLTMNIYNWDITKNLLDFGDVDIFFKVTAIEKLKIQWALHETLVCTISCEQKIGFLLNFHGDIIGTWPLCLSWMHRPTQDQEVVGSSPNKVGNILSWRLIMKYFLWSFSPFCWFKKGNCHFWQKNVHNTG